MSGPPTPDDRPAPADTAADVVPARPAALGFGGTVVKIRGALVAIVGLASLVAIVTIAISALPNETATRGGTSNVPKGQNVVSIATAGFGVIGAIVGAYFGISASGAARDQLETARQDAEAGRKTSERRLTALATATAEAGGSTGAPEKPGAGGAAPDRPSGGGARGSP